MNSDRDDTVASDAVSEIAASSFHDDAVIEDDEAIEGEKHEGLNRHPKDGWKIEKCVGEFCVKSLTISLLHPPHRFFFSARKNLILSPFFLCIYKIHHHEFSNLLSIYIASAPSSCLLSAYKVLGTEGLGRLRMSLH